MSINSTSEATRWQSRRSLQKGVIAGLIGGLVFGIIMALIGMLPQVGMLIRQNNALVGLLVHMSISALFGAAFGVIMSMINAQRPQTTLLIGVLYGLFWWVLGALTLMPILLGMPQRILSIDEMQLYSFLGHILYGVTVGLVMNWLSTHAALQTEIAERKHIAEELRQLNNDLENRIRERTAELDVERAQIKAILDGLGEGVTYNEHYQYKYVNQALCALTGYGPDEFAGRYFEMLLDEKKSDEDLTRLFDEIANTLANGSPWRSEVRLRRKDGQPFDAALTCTKVLDRNGQITGVVTIVQDIGMEKALQEQKSRFIANASHELRTPLTNIKTRLYLIHRQPEQSEAHLTALEQAVSYMAHLVEDLLDTARFERGVIRLRCENVILQTLLSTALQSQQLEVSQKNITLSSDFPAYPIYVFVDPQRITQAFLNLLTNAIHYTPPGGSISINLRPEQGEPRNFALISVRDTGIGMASENLPHIFESFFRANENLASGTGLGLSIAKEIVELHEGTITVDSKSGEGSVFSIKLPIRSHPLPLEARSATTLVSI